MSLSVFLLLMKVSSNLRFIQIQSYFNKLLQYHKLPKISVLISYYNHEQCTTIIHSIPYVILYSWFLPPLNYLFLYPSLSLSLSLSHLIFVYWFLVFSFIVNFLYPNQLKNFHLIFLTKSFHSCLLIMD